MSASVPQGKVTRLRPRIIASTEAVAPEILEVLEDIWDWMDTPETECPLPTPLASRVRTAVVKARMRRHG